MSFNNDKVKATKIRNRFVDIFKKAMAMKQNMIKKGLRVAKAKCPYCEGYWYARLIGKKDHMHMSCDKCDVRVME